MGTDLRSVPPPAHIPRRISGLAVAAAGIVVGLAAAGCAGQPGLTPIQSGHPRREFARGIAVTHCPAAVMR
jgi:hypothetical protein